MHVENSKIPQPRLRRPFTVGSFFVDFLYRPRVVEWALIIFILTGLCAVLLPNFQRYSVRSELRVTSLEGFGQPNANFLSKLPLSFEANQGQMQSGAKFISHGMSGDIIVTANEVILSHRGLTRNKSHQLVTESTSSNCKEIDCRNHAREQKPESRPNITMRMIDAHTTSVKGIDELIGTVNYFIGNDPKNWHTNIKTYAKVRHEDIYPGIDQIFYGNGDQLEYDFIVSPGANPRAIRFRFRGQIDLSIDQVGDLVLHAAGSQEIRLRKPVAYQEIDGARREVSARYVIRRHQETCLEIGAYDQSKQLVIDPTVSVSTYLGASGFDEVNSIAVDASRNIYVAGSTTSPEYASTDGLNAFVMKLNANGDQRIFLTVIGGNGDDRALGLAVDSGNNAVISGTTDSVDFAMTNALQANYGGGDEDAFIAKIGPSGTSLIYSSYIGGSGDDAANGIAVDGAGAAYVTGSTGSPEFSPAGSRDAFVSKFTATGNQRIYFKTIGGSSDDVGSSIAIDSQGSAYIAGATNSADFPILNPAQGQASALNDAFVSKLNPAGSALVYSTYLAGSGDDKAFGISVDGAGSAYVVGSTTSPEFSPVGGADVFVTKLNPSGNQRMYFTTIGGSGDDVGRSITVDQNGNVYLTGSTESNNFPTANPAQRSIGGMSQDAFVTKLDNTGSILLFSTLVGGTGNEVGLGIMIDSDKNLYIGGFTTSLDFPTTNPPFQSANAGGGDGFIAKLVGTELATPTPTPTSSPSPTPTPLGTATSLQLLLDQSGPGVDQAVALDSVLHIRDQFTVQNGSAFFNSAADKNTRVMIFVSNLQMAQNEPSSNVVINLVDSNNESYDVVAEDVRQVPNFQFSQVIFRLPNALAAGTCAIKVQAHGQTSSIGTIRIK
jgi:hypothetical protein